jgi:hypothetical protein
MKIRLKTITVAMLLMALTTPVLIRGKAPAKPDAEKKHKSGPPINADKLVLDMKQAVAFIGMNAKKELNPKSKVEKPFWSGLKKSDQQIKLIESGLKAKNADFIKGINGLGKNLAEMDTAWAILKKQDKHKKSHISKGIANLNKAYALLDKHYGGAAARLKKGGELTDKEKAQVAKAKAEQEKLLAKLLILKGKAKEKSIQSRMTADIIRKVERLSKTEVIDVKTYVLLMQELSELDDIIYGYDQCLLTWEPAYYTEWKTVETDLVVVEEIYSEENWTEYEEWSETEVAFADYGDYYDYDVEVSAEETAEFEEYSESYSEEEATEEVADEEAELDEEMDDGGDEEEDMADEGADDEEDGGDEN